MGSAEVSFDSAVWAVTGGGRNSRVMIYPLRFLTLNLAAPENTNTALFVVLSACLKARFPKTCCTSVGIATFTDHVLPCLMR